ncbi:MAG: hypothetical protein IT558_00610 [Alphaproteobacteria bacterium]|nr:hypothetical protein [Alphaproteobacteria bacterium]
MTRILSFLLANIIGFFSVALCYLIGQRTGAISMDHPSFDAAQFKTVFMGGIMLTWAVCALFSLASLFVRGKMRFVFLLAPIVVPLAYGFAVLLFLPGSAD